MNIGKRLQFARNAIGYTLKQAEDKSGVGISAISEFENSKREPKFSQLSKLANAYKKDVTFFLSDQPLDKSLMLWRKAPPDDERKKTEAEFRQLCQQYHRLELCNNEKHTKPLPEPDQKNADQFNFKDAENLAVKVNKEFCLGDIPSASLKQILEERYYVKIFHLDFNGSAISFYDESLGYAILLNNNSKLWRRNYDLAHELFHLLTWKIFRTTQDNVPGDNEEKFANAFASRLLLPTDAVKDKIESKIDSGDSIELEELDEIAREFCVSTEALLWRLCSLYRIKSEVIQKFVEKYRSDKDQLPERQSDIPDCLPERYQSLAIRALRQGNLSLMQFKKFMRISYTQAEKYLAEPEDFTDEKIAIALT